MSLENKYSIIPPTGVFGSGWPSNFNLTQGVAGGLSTAGWTVDNILSDNFGNEGFVQQTFLGASIRSFNISVGFGDTSSNMTVELVNDEFNVSDTNPLGLGDDPYHDGTKDTFRPPVVGSPVYFKFGKNPCTVEQAFRQTFDDLYGIKTLPDKSGEHNAWGHFFPQAPFNRDSFPSIPEYHAVDLVEEVIEDRTALWEDDTVWRGRNHFTFGGILQSYTQNKGPDAMPLFSAVINDPREILSSVDVLLNNYQGTVFNYKNLINVYGFLEYDLSDPEMERLNLLKSGAGVVKKVVTPGGSVFYRGVFSNWSQKDGWETDKAREAVEDTLRLIGQGGEQLLDQYSFPPVDPNANVKREFPDHLPITGQGFSRRNDKGMPWYRISQALTSLFEYFGPLPREYAQAGFGGRINFRGYNYVVDFSGIPTDKIPLLYFFDFDKMDLLSLAQELCETISHELYVNLLPIINHPACKFLYDYNNEQSANGTPENIIAGIIRLDAIDTTKQPKYGAIKSYLDSLESRGILVENQDVGFELSNITTDKFVVGAQEIDMYLFSTEKDRDDLWKRENNVEALNTLQQTQWHLETQSSQQVIPYYGTLGDGAVSIPRGFGSYQQILLDASELNAFGVGNYYVATELELRAALVSYDSWKNLLLSYNDVYIEDISEISTFFDALSSKNDQIGEVMDGFLSKISDQSLRDNIAQHLSIDQIKDKLFAVTVPRCVWDSDKPYMVDGAPASPCSPPFGYPLYYGRARRIGIVEAGMASLLNAKTRVIVDVNNLKKQNESFQNPTIQVAENSVRIKRDELDHIIGDALGNVQQTLDIQKVKKDADNFYLDIDRMIDIAEENNIKIAMIEDMTRPGNSMSRFMYNLENTAKRHNENAKKVYEFVRKVADECLGKKFLVRVPKRCNLNYSVDIRTANPLNPFNVESGPFGFAPRPINTDPSFVTSALFQLELKQIKEKQTSNPLFHNYLSNNNDPYYSNGALKGNYNPFSEKWEWNYKPEPQGGFHTHSLFGTNLTALDYYNGLVPFSSLPPLVQQGLFPIDSKKLLSDSNRVQCYVKYNNSHLLDFTGVSSDQIAQQSLDNAGQFVPDVIESLPNNNIDAETSFNMISDANGGFNSLNKQSKSVAFVKCDIHEKFYMAPKLDKRSIKVWATDYEFVPSIPEPRIEIVNSFTESSPCQKNRIFQSRIIPIFAVPDDGAPGPFVPWTDYKRIWDRDLKAWMVDTNEVNLDDNQVYVLITVPGRIKATADVRWRDGPMQAFYTVRKKHIMTQDVVKIPEFSQPSLPNSNRNFAPLCDPPRFYIKDYLDAITGDEQANKLAIEAAEKEARKYGLTGYELINDEYYIPGINKDWVRVSLSEVASAKNITKAVMKGFSLSQPEVNLGYTSPSPVFPDIVAIPLMSMERCYGPWLSASQLDVEEDARVRYSNIGGKVEFVKDEELSPWNYAGYQLMNEAGVLKAQFSNSLLLFSERGGFVIPDAPTGITLAKALNEDGPPITSISVSVDQSSSVKTTVKLDLYTSKFGKLQKQKELAIGKISRERQKLLDQRNSAVRRGLGKRQSSVDLVNSVMQAGGAELIKIANETTRQILSNERVGKDFQRTYTVGGNDAVAVYTEQQLMDVISSLDHDQIRALSNETKTLESSPLGMAASTAGNFIKGAFNYITGKGG